MDEKISPGLAKLFNQNLKAHIDLWTEHQALLHVLKNSLPFLPPEVQTEFKKYNAIKKQVWENYLEGLKKTNPSLWQLVAELPSSFPSIELNGQ